MLQETILSIGPVVNPEWVEAWAAVGAAVGAAVALVWQACARRSDRAKGEAKERAVQQSRARAVIVSRAEYQDASGVVHARVDNYGTDPITRLRADVHFQARGVDFRTPGDRVIGVLPPLTDGEIAVSLAMAERVTMTNGGAVAAAMHVDVEFTDLRGTAWRRCGDEVTPIRPTENRSTGRM
jgi:hypothetical protein